MAIRTIKVYCCDTCGVESILQGESSKGWIYGGDKKNTTSTSTSCSRLPAILGENGVAGGYLAETGIWCSVMCYAEHVKYVLEDRGARMLPIKEDE